MAGILKQALFFFTNFLEDRRRLGSTSRGGLKNQIVTLLHTSHGG
jgi:hypothetical protein